MMMGGLAKRSDCRLSAYSVEELDTANAADFRQILRQSRI
jgi:hypothetical protein